ncbi:hypothetical protein DXG01_016895 [Tephrocybe rancida]|nr:hypothetical protein DXG01_016895 [Tephrocybe rancida]
MQATGLYVSPSPHPLYHSAYHPVLPGPQDHELKKQYLALLPPQQIIDICLNFDLHVPPYVKSSIWPPDINAAIAAMRKASAPATETPVASSSTSNGQNPAMNSLADSSQPSATTGTSIAKPSEAQPPDKPPSPPPDAAASTSTPAQETPAVPEQSTPASAAAPAPAPAAATPAATPVASTSTPQPPAYPHQPYGYGHHPQAAYPHTPYYQAPPGYPPYPSPYGYPHQMPGAYPQPHPAYPQPAALPYAPPPAAHAPQQPSQDVFNTNPSSTDDLPSYEEMIVEALTDTADPEGCAPKDLFTWMASHYPLQSNFRPSASQALQKAFRRGRFQKSSGGKYRLNTSWEGGNTSRRTTRRPQTQNPPSASPAPASPFTHAPLVHHNQPSQPTPSFQSQPFGYSFQQQQNQAQGFAGFSQNGQTATPASTTTTANTDASQAGSAQDAWEAAQNILKAINFDSLLSLPKEDDSGEPDQLIAGSSTLGSPPVSLSPIVARALALQAASVNGAAAAAGVEPGPQSYPVGRAELQAQLALLAAQLAELSQEDEDDPVVHYPVVDVPVPTTVTPAATTDSPLGAVAVPPPMASLMPPRYAVPMYAPTTDPGGDQQPVPPISMPEPAPVGAALEVEAFEEEEDSDDDDMEEFRPCTLTTMAKKKTEQPTSKTTSTTKTSAPEYQFPPLSAKEELECRTLLEDQILLIDDLFTPAECKAFVKFIDELPLELTSPKKRGEAERVNHRFSVTSVTFAQRLHALLTPHLPSFPYPTSTKRTQKEGDPPRLPHSFNSNIRVYKYTPEQHFGKHYDDSVRDPMTGAKSEWTLLVYLTGVEDGVEGGGVIDKTLFYKDERGKPQEVISAPLTRGTALLHRHGQECMLHEGSMVTKGNKYVLRSDLMFMR